MNKLNHVVFLIPFHSISCFKKSVEQRDQFPKRSLRDIEGGLTVPMKDAQVWKSEDTGVTGITGITQVQNRKELNEVDTASYSS